VQTYVIFPFLASKKQLKNVKNFNLFLAPKSRLFRRETLPWFCYDNETITKSAESAAKISKFERFLIFFDRCLMKNPYICML